MAANIYSWVALATLFLAIAVAPFTRRVRVRSTAPSSRTDSPAPPANDGRTPPARSGAHLPAAPLSPAELRELRRRRSNRWTRFNFALSGFFAALTAGGFVVDFDAYYEPALAPFAAIAFAILLVPVRFPRSVGVPALIVVLALVAASPVLFAEWYPVRGNATLGAARILSLDEERVRFEWIEREQIGERGEGIGDGTVHVLDGVGVAIGIRVVEVPAQLFFAGADAFARVARIGGIERADGNRAVTGDTVERPAGSGVSGWVTGMLEGGGIPGVRSQEVVAELARPVLLAEYRLEVDGEGRAAIERVSR